MKHYNVIPLMLLLLMSSCTKEDDTLERIGDTVRGRYVLTTMTWGESPIDLDGDGTCSKDLKEEFSVFSFAGSIFTTPVFIHPPQFYDKEEIFHLVVPMQDIKYDKLSEVYSLRNDLSGGCLYIYYSYTVQEDGSLSYQTVNDRIDDSRYWENDWEIEYLDYRYTCGEDALSLHDGTLSVRIKGCYYDFHSGQLVTGPVDLKYERVSFALP